MGVLSLASYMSFHRLLYNPWPIGYFKCQHALASSGSSRADNSNCGRRSLMVTSVDTISSGKDLLFTLLLKVGVAASLAALLARSAIFRKVLFTEVRDSDLKVRLMLFLTPTLAVGVALRLVGTQYRFADLMLEGSFLLGLL